MNASSPMPTTPERQFVLQQGRRARQEDIALIRAEGSMTQALAARFGSVRVIRTAERWQRPRASEALLLGKPCRGGYWCREIVLLAAGRIQLFGRTVIPADARPLQRTLQRLGDRPLMDVLFLGQRLRPGVKRVRRCFGSDPDGNLSRVTLFTVHGEPLLLRESLAQAAEPGARRIWE
jgi:chorismate-pyruvate lyase